MGTRDEHCHCTPLQRERYLGRISGPLLDRISIHVFVRPVAIEAFTSRRQHEASGSMLAQVVDARRRQRKRYHDGGPTALNARLPEKQLRRYCRLDADVETMLLGAQKKLRISARGRSQILRVARTIADLEGADMISGDHILEAVQYRMRDLASGIG